LPKHTSSGSALRSFAKPQPALDLDDEHSLLVATLDATTDGILVVDPNGKIRRFNQRFAQMWRMPQELLDARDDDAAIAYAMGQLLDPDTFVAKVRELYAKAETESFDVVEFIDGRVFERYSIPQRSGDVVVGRVWSFRDVTDRTIEQRARDIAEARATRRLERLDSLWRLQTIGDQNRDGLVRRILAEGRRALQMDFAIIIDANGKSTADGSGEALDEPTKKVVECLAVMNTPESSMRGTVVVDTESGAHSDLSAKLRHCGLRSAIATPLRPSTASSTLAFGSRSVRAEPSTHEDLEYIELLASYLGRVLSDLEQRGQIAYLAYHDSLTGLENRARFLERLGEAVATAVRSSRRLGVLYIDLDRFKDVNDSLGHATGDRVLLEAARRLRSTVRQADACARFGGDEFALLVPEVESIADLEILATRIGRVLAHPYPVDDTDIHLSASIGVVVFPEDGDAPDMLLRHADAAMYRAKEEGRNRHFFYSSEIAARLMRRREIQAGVRDAMEHGALELFYQPIVELASGRTHAVETLLRWHRPGHGVVPAAQFIAEVEESGLMLAVGEWVIRGALEQVGKWVRDGLDMRVAIDLSEVQLHEPGLTSILKGALADHNVDPSRIELEITETAALRNADAAEAVLQECRAMGIVVALDDFGTQYASLSYLKKLTVDVIKIDRSFVAGLPHSIEDAAIVRSVLSLGRSLGRTIVAEGVERPEQAEWLAAEGCSFAQGYSLGLPMAVTEFEAWHASRNAQRGVAPVPGFGIV
jgi:diguanylate cyclase (GGDEF)-like protein